MGSFHPPSRKVRRRLIGAAVAVAVVVLGVTTIKAVKPGGHVTECGVDAKGPYAKVRVNSLLGGAGSIDHEGVLVHFTYDGHYYDTGGSRIRVPTFGSTTTFVRGTWPPRAVDLDGRGGGGRIRVVGHRVSGHVIWLPGHVPHFSLIRMKPDDLSLIGCEVVAPTNGWQ
jgi:hypothetical protein